MECRECKDSRASMERVPYVVYESAVTRHDKQQKRLVIALIIAIILMFASNGMWLAYINQYDFSSTTTSIEAEQDSHGVNIVGAGDVDYGAESKDSHSHEEAHQEEQS